MASRLWQALSGPITVVLLLKTTTLDQRGLYYSMSSLASIQSLFELGLLGLLVSQTGHAMGLIDREKATGRIRTLIHSSQKWFLWVSVLFGIAALAIAAVSFHRQYAINDWIAPLCLLIGATMVTVAMSPSMAILEGAGYREKVYRLRMIQMFLGSLGVWTALAAGWGVWSLPMAALLQTALTVWMVTGEGGAFLKSFRGAPAEQEPESWLRSIGPYQWRVALMSAVHFLATQLFVLIVINFHSKAEAGALGMTLSVTGAIQSLALSWVHTKLSVAATHHGAGEREKAGELWRQIAAASMGMLVVANAVLMLLLQTLENFYPNLAANFITPKQLLPLSMGHVANHAIALQGNYVHARRSLPLAAPNAIGYTCVGIAVWIGGSLYSVDGLVWSYCLSICMLAFPLHTWAYMRYRARK
jgi:hypothetical protein